MWGWNCQLCYRQRTSICSCKLTLILKLKFNGTTSVSNKHTNKDITIVKSTYLYLGYWRKGRRWNSSCCRIHQSWLCHGSQDEYWCKFDHVPRAQITTKSYQKTRKYAQFDPFGTLECSKIAHHFICYQMPFLFWTWPFAS